MSTIDQFESTFRSAIKPIYQPKAFNMRKVLVITDLDNEQANHFTTQLSLFLQALDQSVTLTLLSKENSEDLTTLIDLIDQHDPDLIATHRSLHTKTQGQTYTLGDHIEILTQMTKQPILLFPHHSSWVDKDFQSPDRVMVLTDQLSEHPTLVDIALSIMQTPGELTLAHIEDELIFDRYVNFISKIPEIDTESARALIKEQMYKEAQDFFGVIDQALKSQAIEVNVQGIFKMGHRLRSYVSIVSENEVELVVIQGKDDDQIAIHGLSYPLAIELSHLPLLIV